MKLFFATEFDTEMWKQCKKFLPGLFPNIVVKTNILIFSPKSKLRLRAHPQFASSPVLPGAELMSWGLHGQVTKYGLEFGNRGPGAELWRFSLFGIESRLSLRERFGLATSSPGWSTASNYSHQLCRREKKYSCEIHLWKPWKWLKNKLGFPIVFFENRPLRYNFTPYQVLTIWNVFHHPYLHIYPPTQTAGPHIARMVFT